MDRPERGWGAPQNNWLVALRALLAQDSEGGRGCSGPKEPKEKWPLTALAPREGSARGQVAAGASASTSRPGLRGSRAPWSQETHA